MNKLLTLSLLLCLVSCGSEKSHDHQSVLPFNYIVDIDQSQNTSELVLSIITTDKDVKYIPAFFKVDDNTQDNFLGDLILTTFEKSSNVEYQVTEENDHFVITTKLPTIDKLDLKSKTYDLAFFIDHDGSVAKEAKEKLHRRGHLQLYHTHVSIPE